MTHLDEDALSLERREALWKDELLRELRVVFRGMPICLERTLTHYTFTMKGVINIRRYMDDKTVQRLGLETVAEDLRPNTTFRVPRPVWYVRYLYKMVDTLFWISCVLLFIAGTRYLIVRAV